METGYIFAKELSDEDFIKSVLNDRDVKKPYNQYGPYKSHIQKSGLRGINDCLKDGSASENTLPIKNKSLQIILSKLFHGPPPPYKNWSANIKSYEDPIFKGCQSENITTFKMVKSDTKLSRPFDSRFIDKNGPTVSHDSGIRPDEAITHARCLVHSANSIDLGPGGKCRPCDFFPEKGTELFLSEDVMNLFGFKNLTVHMTTSPGPIFNFRIQFSNGKEQWEIVEARDEKFDRVKTDTEDYFTGNKEKNGKINELLESKNEIEIMKYLIGKELGDVLQVILDTVYMELRKKRDQKRNSIAFTIDGVFAALRLDSGRSQENTYVSLNILTSQSRSVKLCSWKMLSDSEKNEQKFVACKRSALDRCGQLLFGLNVAIAEGEVKISKETYEIGPEKAPRRVFLQELVKRIQDVQDELNAMEFSNANFESDVLKIDSTTPLNLFSIGPKTGEIRFVNLPNLFPKGGPEFRFKSGLFSEIQKLSNRAPLLGREEQIEVRREGRTLKGGARPKGTPGRFSRPLTQSRKSIGTIRSRLGPVSGSIKMPRTATRKVYSGSIQRSRGLSPMMESLQKYSTRKRGRSLGRVSEFHEEVLKNTTLTSAYDTFKCLGLDDEKIEILMTCIEPYFIHLERVIISPKFFKDLISKRAIDTDTCYIDMTLSEFRAHANKISRETREFEKQYYPYMMDDGAEALLVCDGDHEEVVRMSEC